MNVRHLGIFVASTLATAGVLLACSSDSSSSSSSSSGGSSSGSSGSSGSTSSSSGSSGSTDKCALPDGQYKVHYTKKAGSGASCPDLPDQTVTVDSTKKSDAGAGDGGTNGCTTKTDEANCSVTVDCTTKTSGFTTVSNTQTKISNGSLTGSQTSKTTNDADGSVLSDCGYDFTWTKQ